MQGLMHFTSVAPRCRNNCRCWTANCMRRIRHRRNTSALARCSTSCVRCVPCATSPVVVLAIYRLFIRKQASILTVPLRLPNAAKYFAYALITFYLAACSSLQTVDETVDSSHVKQVLYAQYNEWKHVRYRSGGMSKGGIDCSGFVYTTFATELHTSLPRSTSGQVRAGHEISPRDLAAGDLVFFRIGKSTRHVGIYIEDRKFLHASTKKGVMISNLDDRYWKRSYWTSRRVLSR